MGNWAVYIVRCRTGHLYTGYTTDVTRRLKEHNAGIGSKFTRARRPVSLVYTETHRTRSSALSRELSIKRMTLDKKRAIIEAGKIGKSAKGSSKNNF
ncbi:MAG: GIY-YIG nuclease family protein [Thaumarchaeota archaeon]|nr:GIY-YIG nuclease family protein [Nitrososphaerota archaeon]